MKSTSLTLLAILAVTTFSHPAMAQQSFGPPARPGGYGPPPGSDDYSSRLPQDPNSVSTGQDRARDRTGERGGKQVIWDVNRRIEWIRGSIDRGHTNGLLEWSEFTRVRDQLGDIKTSYHKALRDAGGHLDDHQQVALQDRLTKLNDEIRWLQDNGERRPW